MNSCLFTAIQSEGLGTKLQKDITPAERTEWSGGSLAEWAAETYEIAREPDVKYCKINGASCCYPKGNSCEHHGANQTVALNDAYLDEHTEIVESQMKKAGVRLAVLLERSLDSD